MSESEFNSGQSSRSASTEPGCLLSPGIADFTNIERCEVSVIRFDGKEVNVDLPAGWLVSDLVSALNVAIPGSVELNGSELVIANGKAFANFELGCLPEEYTVETFEDFETPVRNNQASPGNSGNNIIGDTFGDWKTQNGARFNIVRADGVSEPAGIGPVTGATGGLQYVDIAGADDSPVFPFTIPNPSQVEIRAFLANREPGAGSYRPWTGQVEILDAETLEIVASGNSIEFTSEVSELEWFESVFIGTIPAGRYLFRVFVGNSGHLDDVSIRYKTVEFVDIPFEPNGQLTAVEIVKVIDHKTGDILIHRVFSPDGTEEYVAPFENSAILVTGACPLPTRDPVPQGPDPEIIAAIAAVQEQTSSLESVIVSLDQQLLELQNSTPSEIEITTAKADEDDCHVLVRISDGPDPQFIINQDDAATSISVTGGSGLNGNGRVYTLRFAPHPNGAAYGQAFTLFDDDGQGDTGAFEIISKTATEIIYQISQGDDGGSEDDNDYYPHEVKIFGSEQTFVTDVFVNGSPV